MRLRLLLIIAAAAFACIPAAAERGTLSLSWSSAGAAFGGSYRLTQRLSATASVVPGGFRERLTHDGSVILVDYSVLKVGARYDLPSMTPGPYAEIHVDFVPYHVETDGYANDVTGIGGGGGVGLRLRLVSDAYLFGQVGVDSFGSTNLFPNPLAVSSFIGVQFAY